MMRHGAIGVLAAALCIAAVGAAAHKGATGVVLDRMNGMTAMRDVMANLAPMMQGTAPYDPAVVSEGARILEGHAGASMADLFPEGSSEGTTFAKPEIWSEWDRFTALADELEAYARSLEEAAPNGLAPPAPPDPMAGMDHSAMAMPASPPPQPTFTVAQLLGYAETVTPETASDPGPPSDLSAAPESVLAVPDIFERIGATCSACHSRFREGRN